MRKLKKIYEGKAKIIYATDDPDTVIQYFKDDATAFNGVKKGTIVDKGVVNNHVSSRIFKYLESKGIKTHFVKALNDREMLIKKLEIIPIEVVLRNVAAGSLAKRMGRPEGEKLKQPIVEFYYKNDNLGDPMINDYHAQIFGLATAKELETLKTLGLKINSLLVAFLKKRKIRLVDFKLEFGRYKRKILLGDEISPDGCRLWDWDTNEKMDKDRFRFDLGKVEETYQKVYHLICDE